MRFDVPVIGVKTIETMATAGATCLAIDAGKCLLLDGDRIITAADAAGYNYRLGLKNGKSGIDDLVHRAFHETQDANDHYMTTLGVVNCERWHYDQGTGKVTFLQGGRAKICM